MAVRLFLALLAALLLIQPLPASAAGRHMQVSLAAETLTPRPGSEVALALVMTPQPGWHGYWLNTGDAGTPNRFQWSLPAGASLQPLLYPAPQRLIVAGLMNYVYEKPYALLARLTLPEGILPGTPVDATVAADYLVCSDTLCVPEQAQATVRLVAGDGQIMPQDRARFDVWRAALPRPLGATARFAMARDGRLMLFVPLAGADRTASAYFYPAVGGVIDHAAPQKAGISGNGLVIAMPPARTARALPRNLDGVLRIERPGGPLGLAISATPGAVPPADTWLAPAAPFTLSAFLLTVLAAIAGGLILNAMPCVFPILSLKALSLARSGESPGAARVEALAYGAGVMLACLALGGIILGLRAGGESVGWAFQLQNPHIILALLLLTAAIGLNLAGLFDLPSLSLDHPGSPANRPSAAFLTGILAAFIATPCTGPFMGAALGSALVLPWPAALGVFAGLGLGLALPFVAIAYLPALRRRLPRPGPWMERFRRVLAVPMLLTAAALGWVLWRQTGAAGLALGLGAAILLALLLWWSGVRQARGHSAGPTAALAVLAFIAPLLLAGPIASTAPPKSARLGGQAFSETRLAALRAQNRPVFVYFTADWCLTCKVNEQAAINRTIVRDAFNRKGVVTLVGDWTEGDPAITRFLERHGRNGVPLYLFYPANGAQPQVLPQVLTASGLAALPN